MNEGIKEIDRTIKYLQREIDSQCKKRYSHMQAAISIGEGIQKEISKLNQLKAIVEHVKGDYKHD